MKANRNKSTYLTKDANHMYSLFMYLFVFNACLWN